MKIAVDALKARRQRLGARSLGPDTLEVAILDANRPRRAFRRITGSALEALLPVDDSEGTRRSSPPVALAKPDQPVRLTADSKQALFACPG